MRTIAMCAAVAAVLLMSACDWEPGDYDYQSFSYDLQGTWVSDSGSLYSGSLEIDYGTIIIRGYDREQTPQWGGDDNKRPFKELIRDVALNGYSTEEDSSGAGNSKNGTIHIEYIDEVHIPYTYSRVGGYPYTEVLLFYFGGEPQTLIKQKKQ